MFAFFCAILICFLKGIVMERNFLLDNAKFLMIFLVVFGHTIQPFIENDLVFKIIFMNIYSYHMPVFIIISGMLTKVSFNSEDLKKSLTSALFPFFAFTLIYEISNILLVGDISYQSKNLYPYPILWFLYSLFIWKISLPILLSFRFPISISIVISISAGYFESIGDFLGIARTLYFLPFYIIGYKIVPNLLSNIKMLSVPKVVWLLIFIANVVFFIFFNDMSAQWLFGSWSYPKLGHFDWSGGVIRLLLFGISLATAISILFIIPKEKIWITKKGENTLYIYLWHGFFLEALFFVIKLTNLADILPAFIILLILLCFSFVTVLFLSSNYILKFTQGFILKPVNRLLAK